jgi:hypothetical protein
VAQEQRTPVFSTSVRTLFEAGAAVPTGRVARLSGPLGAVPGEDGLVEFRVWAPRAPSVAVELEGEIRDLEESAERLRGAAGRFRGGYEPVEAGPRVCRSGRGQDEVVVSWSRDGSVRLPSQPVTHV